MVSRVLGMDRKAATVSFLYFLPSLLAVAYFTYVWRHFQLDDALIYLRYVRNFHEGHGLVYNPGEKFNGLTSPFFSYLIVLGSFVVRNLHVLTLGVAAVCLAATGFLGGRILCSTELGQAFTSFVIVTFGYFYSTFGMETPLFLMLIALSLYLYRKGSDYFVISLALVVATRGEGIFLALPMAFDYLLRHRRLPDLRLCVIGALIFITPFLISRFYYGAFLPATGDAKIGQGQSGFWGAGWIFFNVEILLGYNFHHSLYPPILLSVMAVCGAYLGFRQPVTKISLVFVCLLLAFYAGLNIPNYHWYYAPFFFFAVVFACFWIVQVVAKLWTQVTQPGARVALGFILIAAFLPSYVKSLPASHGGGRNERYAEAGNWLATNLQPNTSVALVEIGTVGWYGPNTHIIDILGLTNKYNADFIAKRDTLSWLTKYQPDYILRHEPPWPFEAGATHVEKRGMYSPAPGFNIPGLVLLKKSDAVTDAQIIDAASSKPEK